MVTRRRPSQSRPVRENSYNSYGNQILISNHLSLSAEEIFRKYLLRWGLECIFRDLKENLYFDHYQVRSIKAISRHWHLTSLAYTFLMVCKLNGRFSKTFHEKPKTCGEQLEMFRKINSLTSLKWLIKKYEFYQHYLGIKTYPPANLLKI